jgi:hypothetical protein
MKAERGYHRSLGNEMSRAGNREKCRNELVKLMPREDDQLVCRSSTIILVGYESGRCRVPPYRTPSAVGFIGDRRYEDGVIRSLDSDRWSCLRRVETPMLQATPRMLHLAGRMPGIANKKRRGEAPGIAKAAPSWSIMMSKGKDDRQTLAAESWHPDSLVKLSPAPLTLPAP